MESAEASGKTVEDALNRALTQLGARREEVEFVVLDEGKRGGLFGRGAKEARVRVDRTGGAPPADDRSLPDTRIPRGPQGGGGRGGRGGRDRFERGGGRPDGPGNAADRGPRGNRPPQRTQTRTGFDAPVPRLTAEDFNRAPRPAEGGDAPQQLETAARGQRPPRNRPERSERPERPDRPDRGDRGERRRPREEQPHIDPDINAEEVDLAAHVVDDILRLLDIPAELTIREPITPGDGLGVAKAVIDISGDDLGLLIGRRGDTLASLQYLVNLIVARRFPGQGGVNIDVEHYRHRREEQVMAIAMRMADRVRETGSPITLEPMSASERRLVHMALAEDPELMTNSIGEGENRKVVISTKE
ncbi:MAG: RNA-binding cell elongation regulator Jag/EloR [Dehalococcoidia bacterium]